MNAVVWSRKILGIAAVAVCLLTGSLAWADDQKGQQDSSKGKDTKPNVIQIDLNKLPPDVAKRLLELSLAEAKKAPEAPTKGKVPAVPAAPAKGTADTKKAKATDSQQEQTGQHEDKDDAKKDDKGKPATKPQGKATDSQNQQTGQHEDKDDEDGKAKKDDGDKKGSKKKGD